MTPKGIGYEGDNDFIFEIEWVRRSTLKEGIVNISGWCFDKNLTEVSAIRYRTSDSEYNGNYGIKRSELLVLGEELAIIHSGFDVSVPTSSDKSTFILEAQKADTDEWLAIVEIAFMNPEEMGGSSIINKTENGRSYRVNHGFCFQIDEPENYKSNGNNTRLRGWCFSKDRSKIRNLRCKIDEELFDSRFFIERRELDYMFEQEDEILHSGFEFSLKISQGTTAITIEAQLENKKWVAVTHGSLCKPFLLGKILYINE